MRVQLQESRPVLGQLRERRLAVSWLQVSKSLSVYEIRMLPRIQTLQFFLDIGSSSSPMTKAAKNAAKNAALANGLSAQVTESLFQPRRRGAALHCCDEAELAVSREEIFWYSSSLTAPLLTI